MESLLEGLYAQYLEHPIISTDTRNLIPNSIFFALKGERFNANAFAAFALDNGCVLAVVDDPNVAVDNRYILVDDVTTCLQDLATHHRKQLDIPVIGITGTNGKTTTKELLNAVLSTQFKTHATQGNFNNHIGVPLTILSTPKDTEILIVEMGANHAGEIAELCEISQPNFGLITSLGLAHLEGFGSFETIVETKTALYRSVKKNNGLVFVNNEIDRLMAYSEHQNRLMYGSEHGDFTGSLVDDGIFVSLSYKSQIIRTKLTGDYNFSNVLAACAIGDYFKVSLENIKQGLENYTPSNNRSQLVKTDKNTLILDAYNANPTSTKAALESFAKLNCDKKFFVLGDMLELGNDSLAEHQHIFALVQKLTLREGIFVGDIFQSLTFGNVKTFKNADEARDFLIKQTFDGYTFLIKGSRGIRLETVIDVL
ncbi:MAG: UDP-N-acetylmuramoyl-tripeptide--D-alanyl-D-alanine ligase [Bacteroidales bacterium]|jgi:UDP-N-acetylmuramoyl-tripeptide--D-alanyl-D-alanine ligase|nr:UDP-N-acetylmuramoyl-tripeptide--D-alanyl-D-alanine ligase [Bacteroidales bacterium]